MKKTAIILALVMSLQLTGCRSSSSDTSEKSNTVTTVSSNGTLSESNGSSESVSESSDSHNNEIEPQSVTYAYDDEGNVDIDSIEDVSNSTDITENTNEDAESDDNFTDDGIPIV